MPVCPTDSPKPEYFQLTAKKEPLSYCNVFCNVLNQNMLLSSALFYNWILFILMLESIQSNYNSKM